MEGDLHQRDFFRLTLLVRKAFRFFAVFDFMLGLAAGTPSIWMTAALTHKICGSPSSILLQFLPSSRDPYSFPLRVPK
jgi:hypothetical protein